MIINNDKVSAIRNIRAIVIASIFLLASLVFIGLGVYLVINKDNNQGEENSLLGNIIFIGVGVLFAVVSIIVIIKTVKKMKNNKPLTEEEVKANEEKESLENRNIENVTDTKLYFHFGGKLNQSFFVEDRNGITRYECRLKKFNLVGANTFEFVDINHNYSKEFKMGKAVTSSADGGIPIMGDELSSSFKINGVNCWEYLRNKGYKINHRILEKSLVSYELTKFGKTVANIIPVKPKDPWGEENNTSLLVVKGCFRLEIIDCKLEDVVVAAFIIYQTNIVE